MVGTALSDTGSQTARFGKDRGGHQPHALEQNVGQTERWISMLAGGGLVAFGLARGRLGGLLSAIGGAALIQRGLTGYCRMYEALGYSSDVEHHDFGVKAGHGKKIVHSLHINRDRESLYDFWRNIENLPLVMRHLESVTSTGGDTSHWVARGPLNARLEWDAEIKTERRPEIIAWQSLPGSQVATAGSVRFEEASGGQGTLLTVTLKYDPPGGTMAADAAHALGQGLEEELEEDLRGFKSLAESGEPLASSRSAGQHQSAPQPAARFSRQ
jgi:uncharacterized membrane protein